MKLLALIKKTFNIRMEKYNKKSMATAAIHSFIP